MKTPPIFPLWIDDYMADTRTLTTAQHGAYILILLAMWQAGGRLPNEDRKLALIARLTTDKWRKMAGDILPFFTVEDGEIVHFRILQELKNSFGKMEKRKAAGKTGGLAKSLKNKEQGLANATANDVANAEQKGSYINRKLNSISNLKVIDTNHTPNPSGSSPSDGEATQAELDLSSRPLDDRPRRRRRSVANDNHDHQDHDHQDRDDQPAKAKPDPRGTRLPEDWEPSEADLKAARDFGLTMSQLRVEVEKFREYWLAKAGKEARKVNWSMTWRTWLRKSKEWSSGGRPQNLRRPAI